jgi:hypothetical protein
MAKYQDLLLNGLNKIISDLVNGQQPTLPPGDKAWDWLKSPSGSQPAAVNDYVQVRIDSKTATTASFSSSQNWATWSDRMQAKFPSATGSVATWLGTNYAMMAADVPTVPDDVIAWTKATLPSSSMAVDVAVKAGAPSPVSR